MRSNKNKQINDITVDYVQCCLLVYCVVIPGGPTSPGSPGGPLTPGMPIEPDSPVSYQTGFAKTGRDKCFFGRSAQMISHLTVSLLLTSKLKQDFLLTCRPLRSLWSSRALWSSLSWFTLNHKNRNQQEQSKQLFKPNLLTLTCSYCTFKKFPTDLFWCLRSQHEHLWTCSLILFWKIHRWLQWRTWTTARQVTGGLLQRVTLQDWKLVKFYAQNSKFIWDWPASPRGPLSPRSPLVPGRPGVPRSPVLK